MDRQDKTDRQTDKYGEANTINVATFCFRQHKTNAYNFGVASNGITFIPNLMKTHQGRTQPVRRCKVFVFPYDSKSGSFDKKTNVTELTCLSHSMLLG